MMIVRWVVALGFFGRSESAKASAPRVLNERDVRLVAGGGAPTKGW